MPEEIKEVRPEPGGSWTVDFTDGGTRVIRADWIQPEGDWVKDGLVALTRADATDCIAYTPTAN